MKKKTGTFIKSLGVPCPECSQELVLKQGRFGMFIGCSAYPLCHHVEKKEHDEQEKKLEQMQCPECKVGKITNKTSRYGKSFFSCNTYPACRFIVNNQPTQGVCSSCAYSLLLLKTNADKTVKICANKICQAKQ